MTSILAHAEIEDATLVTPLKALRLALSSPLKFIGTYISHGSESGTVKACVFRNEHATVVYEYCTKPEAPATGIFIYPKGYQSGIRYYVESDNDPSTVKREDYEEAFWSLRAVTKKAQFNDDMSPEAMRDYERDSKSSWACAAMSMSPVGRVFKCNPSNLDFNYIDEVSWLQDAQSFWITPPELWYKFLVHMRALVDRVPE